MEFKDMLIKDIQAVVRYQPNLQQWNARERSVHYIGMALKGKVTHTFKKKKFSVDENCVYFFNQKDYYHAQITENPVESFSIHFTTYEKIDTDSFCFRTSNPTLIYSLLQKAVKAQNNNNTLELYALTYSICSEINRMHEKKYFPKDKRILDAKEYMDENFNCKNCLEEAIQRSGVTQRRFGEIFLKVFDTTPNRYITYRKIEYAKSLLSTGGFSVADVASICNFTDIYYFSKVFKKITGVNPSKWKSL